MEEVHALRFKGEGSHVDGDQERLCCELGEIP